MELPGCLSSGSSDYIILGYPDFGVYVEHLSLSHTSHLLVLNPAQELCLTRPFLLQGKPVEATRNVRLKLLLLLWAKEKVKKLI